MTEREPFPTVLHLAEYLGLGLYDWQAKICLKVDQLSTQLRQHVAVITPNGAGKSSRIIPTICLRWLERYPAGKIVVTSSGSRQIADQVWPALRRYVRRFPGWRAYETDRAITTREGGKLRAFTTDDPGRQEGFHGSPGAPLLIIVDEAKSIDPLILEAIDRCTYAVLLYISTPGGKEGPLYDAFTSQRAYWHCTHAGLVDCPHIPKETIEDWESRYGPEDPTTRSALHGEFMEDSEGIVRMIELKELERWQSSKVGLKDGHMVITCDFAAGGDANVCFQRIGNRIGQIVVWHETNTAAAIGRFTGIIRDMGYGQARNVHVFGDGSGLGKPFCDLIRQNGIDIAPINFGGKPSDPIAFKDLGSEMWYRAIEGIRRGVIVCPPMHQPGVKDMMAQLSARHKVLHSSGKAWMETKQEMKARGIASPDIADAFAMAFGCTVPTAYTWAPFSDPNNWREIAESHSWDYSDGDHGQSDKHRDEDRPGYGGVHSIW